MASHTNRARGNRRRVARDDARNLTDRADGFLREAKHLIHDRDPRFAPTFESILRERGVECVKIPAQNPNRSPHAERFVKTTRYACLNHLVVFG
jgi:putative transposase